MGLCAFRVVRPLSPSILECCLCSQWNGTPLSHHPSPAPGNPPLFSAWTCLFWTLCVNGPTREVSLCAHFSPSVEWGQPRETLDNAVGWVLAHFTEEEVGEWRPWRPHSCHRFAASGGNTMDQ